MPELHCTSPGCASAGRTAQLAPTQLLISPQHGPAGKHCMQQGQSLSSSSIPWLCITKLEFCSSFETDAGKGTGVHLLNLSFLTAVKSSSFPPRISSTLHTELLTRQRQPHNPPACQLDSKSPAWLSFPEGTGVLCVSPEAAPHLTCPRSCWERADGN